jgi:hypothetical protein
MHPASSTRALPACDQSRTPGRKLKRISPTPGGTWMAVSCSKIGNTATPAGLTRHPERNQVDSITRRAVATKRHHRREIGAEEPVMPAVGNTWQPHPDRALVDENRARPGRSIAEDEHLLPTPAAHGPFQAQAGAVPVLRRGKHVGDAEDVEEIGVSSVAGPARI